MTDKCTPGIPNGMITVSKDQFFAALFADPRDIMPNNENPEFTTWETKARMIWGWTAPGYKNPRAHEELYAVYPSALSKTRGQQV
jgi:hypothetical protein